MIHATINQHTKASAAKIKALFPRAPRCAAIGIAGMSGYQTR